MKVYLLEENSLENKNLTNLLLKGSLQIAKREIRKEIAWKIKINAVIHHISESRNNFKMPHAKQLGECSDKTVLYEMRIKVSSYSLRLFFVCYLDKIIIYNFLLKPYKYEKQIKKKVDQKYEVKIREAKKYHSQFIDGSVELIEYINISV
jgi:hypothetical protein